MKNRNGEKAKNWFRSSRFYNLKGQWFFTTREGIEHGPFESKDNALQELKNYINMAYQHSFSTLAYSK